MPGLTYNSFVSEIATITAITSGVLVNGDNNFNGIMDALIDYAEGRLSRDLDLPIQTLTSTDSVCSSGDRTFSIINAAALYGFGGEPLVIECLNIQTPAGATSSYSTRVPLIPTSLALIDAVYPNAASSCCGLPVYFYRVSQQQLILGPAPDQPYRTEITYTYRPSALSATNPVTWLSRNLPEMMIAAGMVFAAGYMRDFGSQADDPKMAQSWEAQYNTLLKAASPETARMNFASEGWTSEPVSPTATPPRV